jgi:Lon protease-like protein
MLPSTIPIFPLPNVVLFPGVFLPLHVFEPRYREMVADALDGDRVIGMVLLKPGWEPAYEGRPPVYETGCAGLITHVERLPDGRFDIVLKGLSKFRLHGEESGRSYRLGRVEPVLELVSESDREGLRDGRQQLELMLAPAFERTERHLPANLADDEVVNALSQYLDLEPVERQALLECAGPVRRCALLLELLHLKALSSGRHPGAEVAH